MENLERKVDPLTGLKQVSLNLLPTYTYRSIKGNYEMSKLDYFRTIATDLIMLTPEIMIGAYFLKEIFK